MRPKSSCRRRPGFGLGRLRMPNSAADRPMASLSLCGKLFGRSVNPVNVIATPTLHKVTERTMPHFIRYKRTDRNPVTGLPADLMVVQK
jgi:hypothetical protein